MSGIAIGIGGNGDVATGERRQEDGNDNGNGNGNSIDALMTRPGEGTSFFQATQTSAHSQQDAVPEAQSQPQERKVVTRATTTTGVFNDNDWAALKAQGIGLGEVDGLLTNSNFFQHPEKRELEDLAAYHCGALPHQIVEQLYQTTIEKREMALHGCMFDSVHANNHHKHDNNDNGNAQEGGTGATQGQQSTQKHAAAAQLVSPSDANLKPSSINKKSEQCTGTQPSTTATEEQTKAPVVSKGNAATLEHHVLRDGLDEYAHQIKRHMNMVVKSHVLGAIFLIPPEYIEDCHETEVLSRVRASQSSQDKTTVSLVEKTKEHLNQKPPAVSIDEQLQEMRQRLTLAKIQLAKNSKCHTIHVHVHVYH
jgi:hypothetical protein